MKVATYLGSFVQVLWAGRNTENKYVCVGGVLTVPGPHWVCPHSHMFAFPVYTAQAPGCSAGELSQVGPGFRALPRSKPLRFRFSGTPQKHRLAWACGLCPSQVQAAQATRCLLSTPPPPRWAVCLVASLVPAPWFPGCTAGAPSQVCRVSPLGS